METSKSNLAHQIIAGSPSEWIRPFDVEKFVNNPPLIEKLFEEKQLAYLENIELKARVKKLEDELHEADLNMERSKNSIKALKYYEEALAINRELGDRRRGADLLFNMSYINKELGNTSVALELATQSLEIYKELMLPYDNKVDALIEELRTIPELS